jgi:hypothetical protein
MTIAIPQNYISSIPNILTELSPQDTVYVYCIKYREYLYWRGVRQLIKTGKIPLDSWSRTYEHDKMLDSLWRSIITVDNNNRN